MKFPNEAEIMKVRGEIIAKAVKNFGPSKVRQWANDPAGRNAFNEAAALLAAFRIYRAEVIGSVAA